MPDSSDNQTMVQKQLLVCLFIYLFIPTQHVILHILIKTKSNIVGVLFYREIMFWWRILVLLLCDYAIIIIAVIFSSLLLI